MPASVSKPATGNAATDRVVLRCGACLLLSIASCGAATIARAQDASAAKTAAEEARLARERAAAAARQAAEEALAAKAALKAAADRADACLKVKLSRTPDDVFRAVARMNAAPHGELSDEQRFQLFFQAGEWERLGGLLAGYPGDYPTRLYGRVLNELVFANPKPVLLPTDVLRLADASPAPLDDKTTVGIGRLLAVAVAKTDARNDLVAALKQGTARLGGTDPARRHAAARVLAAAEFWNEARAFGLKESEIPELAAGLSPVAPPRFTEENWASLLAAFRDADADAAADEREAAASNLHHALLQATPRTVRRRFDSLVRDEAQAAFAWEIVALVGRKTARGQVDFDFGVRRINLELQDAAMRSLAAARRLDVPPGPAFANLSARNWLAEARQSLAIFPTWRKAAPESREKYQHVGLEDLLRTAPAGDWLALVEPPLAGSVRLLVARLLLLSDDPDRLVPQLAEFSRRDPAVAAELANAYLVQWAQRHDPALTPEAVKQFKVEGPAIVLTRAEQEHHLEQLGAMLASLDPATRRLLDEALVVTAFDLCHSKAEIHTREQIVQVFGPIEELPSSLLLALVERMRLKLGSQWRNLAVQRDAATNRDAADVFRLVDGGYAEAGRIADEWLETHPDDWRTTSTSGAILADWAEFAYFQAVAAGDDADRFGTYLARSAEAQRRFRAGAQAYAEALPKLNRAEFSLVPFRTWFHGLLGIAHDGDVNLRKGVARESLHELRDALRGRPGGAAAVHLQLFSTMVADAVKANVVAPQMKYRWLSSAVEITGRNATTYPAAEKVQYYESLLREIRLRARLDGGDRIRKGGDFGVFVTLVHTAELARESGGFGKYLQNEIRRTVSGRSVVERPLYRDRFEEALRLALGDFFEIKAIVFADPGAGARPVVPDDPATAADATSAGGSPARIWQETPLAYLHLVAKDATVDRVPPLEIELDFYDRDGKVVLPLSSTPLLVEISDSAPARRPAVQIAVTEIVDARELVGTKRLKLDVVATARGLTPGLDELLDLPGCGLAALRTDDREGVHVSELHSGDDGLYAVSERNWTVELDPTPLLTGAQERVDFRFPQPLSDAVAVAYRKYEDLDPVDAAAQVTLIEGAEAAAIARPNYVAWTIGGLVALIVVGVVATVFLRRRSDETEAGPPAFVAPREATPFAVVTLLHRIRSSPEAHLTEAERGELQREIAALERASFAAQPRPCPTHELESLVERWIRTALGTRPRSPAA